MILVSFLISTAALQLSTVEKAHICVQLSDRAPGLYLKEMEKSYHEPKCQVRMVH